MAIDIKYIFFLIFFLCFLFNEALAIDSKLTIKKNEAVDYVPLKVNFDKIEVIKVYAKWKKYNTGTYVCIAKSTFTDDDYAIHFIKNNTIVKYLALEDPKYISRFNVKDIDTLALKKDVFDTPVIPNSSYCIIDNIFKKALEDLPNSPEYDCLEYNLQFDKNNRYIRVLKLGRVEKVDTIHHRKYYVPCKRRVQPLIFYGKKEVLIHIDGLMMLPRGTKYTNQVIEKILTKYKQAMECKKRLLDSKKTNDEQNLTLLEKAVGKEKLECLDRYLVWDENGSK